MEFPQILLTGFNGREEALNRIKRYIHEITRVMYYRTSDLTHSRRVLWHLESAISNILSVYSEFDINFARTLALVHDDIEILIGDPQLYDKERMSPEELEKLYEKEKDAIKKMPQIYGQIANGYDYATLLTAAKEKVKLESQFVSFFDKYDGAGEAWHEVFAGNYHFLRPANMYIKRLCDFPTKYAAMEKFFDKFPGYLPYKFDFNYSIQSGKPYTSISLQNNSGYAPYERWKRTIIQREGID